MFSLLFITVWLLTTSNLPVLSISEHKTTFAIIYIKKKININVMESITLKILTRITEMPTKMKPMNM